MLNQGDIEEAYIPRTYRLRRISDGSTGLLQMQLECGDRLPAAIGKAAVNNSCYFLEQKVMAAMIKLWRVPVMRFNFPLSLICDFDFHVCEPYLSHI